ncbi:MAG: efflux RND transporter permease subunit [Pirellulaceae bacterium]|nr:efflux RND transporter permease subunit [Pirellulaceae bacterium]
MLDGLLRFSLRQRVLVITLAIVSTIYGLWRTSELPIDVFPSLDRPRVVVMTESPGLAPEEVETLITFPLESSLNGATGVQAVRSASDVGLSVIYVEFDWGSNVFADRQIVAERLALARDRFPPGVVPQLAPISSIMGQIMIVGMWSESDATSPMELRTLADWVVRQRLLTIPGVSQVFVMGGERMQFQVLVDPQRLVRFGVALRDVETALAESNENATGGYLERQGPNELLVRSLGRIHTVEEVGDVVVAMRDGRPVLVRDVASVKRGAQIKRGDSAAYVRGADGRFSGGPAIILTVTKQPEADTRRVTELITAALVELQSTMPDDVRIDPALYQQKTFIDVAIGNVMGALRDASLLVVLVLFFFLLSFRTTFITLTAIPLSIVVTVVVFALFDLSINTMTMGGLAVAIGGLVDDATVSVENIFRRLKLNRRSSTPKSALAVVFDASAEVRNPRVYGTLIVVLVFAPVFALSGMEGRLFTPLAIAFLVSVVSSLIVSLTVTPILSYWLLGQSRTWSVLAAFLSLPVALAISVWAVPWAVSLAGLSSVARWWSEMSFWGHGVVGLLMAPGVWFAMVAVERLSDRDRDGLVLRSLHFLADRAVALGITRPGLVLGTSLALVVASAAGLLRLESDFLPPFDEGSVQINLHLPPGTSLETSREVAAVVEQRLQEIDDVVAMVRKTGRAELDEHADPVSVSEMIATLDPRGHRPREEVLHDIRDALAEVPGIVSSVEQPLSHLISHMVAGVKAQVGIKLYGDDLDVLRRKVEEIRAAIADVPGVIDLQVEPQVEIPQLRVEIDGHRLQRYGLRRAEINHLIETALHGQVVSEILDGQRTIDLIVRFGDDCREDIEALRRLRIDLPDGGSTSLSSVAEIYPSSGPNTINREQTQRRIVVQCNTTGRGLVDVVRDIQSRLEPLERSLPPGYFVEYGGQFESQQEAAGRMGLYSIGVLLGMFLILYGAFRSANLAIQVMIALPAAFVGSVAALYLTGQTLTVAAMVGFISLCGIAVRNGILLFDHYLHLVRHEGESWTKEMVLRAGRERVAPVMMTALTSGIGLLPLALAAGEPGKEILYPVATVIIGGLITSTAMEFFVRPALFWRFGLRAAEAVVHRGDEEELATKGSPSGEVEACV